MIVGMMLAGIVAGGVGVAWSIASGLPLLVTLLIYPAAGLAGTLLFLAVALIRPGLSLGFRAVAAPEAR